MTSRALFGAVIVVLLLGLYVFLARFAISLLTCVPQPGCLGDFSDVMTSALALIGGLVSAVVIAELAVSSKNKPPFSRLLDDNPDQGRLNVLRGAAFLYVAAWLGVGFWALVATWRHPDSIPALTALARSWLGLAISAGYAFFNLKPST